MKAQQRAFIHALAGDFGLDSESMDPEPHRHVMIWKTPRFVSPPNKTLAEALRIQQAQLSATRSANVSDNEGARPANPQAPIHQPYNAFVIPNPRFGLTVDELRCELTNQFHPSMGIAFDIEFLPSEAVVLKASSPNATPENLQKTLWNMKTQLVAAISLKGFGSPELCEVDVSLNIIHRESDHAGTDGWSKVAAKRAAPKIGVPGGITTGAGSNAFSALGGGGSNSNKVTFTKRNSEKPKPKPNKEVVVDDWEAAEAVEEEKENGGSGDEGRPSGELVAATDDPMAQSQESSAGVNGAEATAEAKTNAGIGDWATAVEEERS